MCRFCSFLSCGRFRLCQCCPGPAVTCLDTSGVFAAARSVAEVVDRIESRTRSAGTPVPSDGKAKRHLRFEGIVVKTNGGSQRR